MRVVLAIAFAVGLGTATQEASAHALDVDTARVVVRDGDVEIHAELDVLAWIEESSGTPALALSDGDPAELARRTAIARQRLVDGVQLELDGERVGTRVRVFPADGELVHASARWLVAREIEEHAHRPRARVVLEALRPVAGLAQVQVRFPEALGQVLVTFVEPRTRLVEAGAASRFAARPSPSAIVEPSMTVATEPSLGALVGAFAGGLLLGTLAWRFRRSSPSTPSIPGAHR